MSAGVEDPFLYRCPSCRSPLEAEAEAVRRCPLGCGDFSRSDGIWRFLPADRIAFFERFTREYETVRRAEGRGSDDPSFYRALPSEDRSGRFTNDWRIRARSFRTFLEGVVRPLELEVDRPLRALDLGAGNAWLSHRLAERGHKVAAVDLLVNAFDGLGAYPRYAEKETYPGRGRVVPIQAEFDRLPFGDEEFDLVVFNGSLHYSSSYEDTLGEALRVLHAESGALSIMDSPIYRNASSGREMVREREEHFQRLYGFRSDSLPSEQYLTYERLGDLGGKLGLDWRYIEPFYGIRWAVRPWKARLLGRREPARFAILVARRGNGR